MANVSSYTEDIPVNSGKLKKCYDFCDFGRVIFNSDSKPEINSKFLDDSEFLLHVYR
jgi:hypothetical protein